MGFYSNLRRALSPNLPFPLNLKLWRLLGEPPIAVTFTGGLGAQVISTAIYEKFMSVGLPVCADFSYFNSSRSINKGDPLGGVSRFPWQLNDIGLSQSCFEVLSPKSIPWFTINDGPVKLGMFLEAVRDPSVRSKLSVVNRPDLISEFLPANLSGQRYGCVHIRRGDYLSVASHILTDSQLAKACGLWGADENIVVVLSDSPIGQETRDLFRRDCRKTFIFADTVSPISSFIIMQNAQYLICSNSQFSLSAGMCAGVPMLIPSRWYSYPTQKYFKRSQDGNLAHLEYLLFKSSDFMLVKPLSSDEEGQRLVADGPSFFKFIASI